MGTDVPGLFAAGTFFYHGELVFWDVRHFEQTISCRWPMSGIRN
jgi:hypothetical protein